ncbi:hypothetical protein RJ55_01672 [Drechmeria coniospora]|nr:hypothetical protein RJ55_01672 [Drechmeria coniospora]
MAPPQTVPSPPRRRSADRSAGTLTAAAAAAESRRMAVLHELFMLCLDGRLMAARLPIDRPQPKRKYTATQLTPSSSSPSSSSISSFSAARSAAVPDPGYASVSTSASASIEEPTTTNGFRILDIGAGNGLWAVQVARRYPSASVLGIDVSPALFPSSVPSNCSFDVLDASNPDSWSPDRTFDFIHMRNLIGGGIHSFQSLLALAFAHLRPGGQVEFTEVRPRFFSVAEVQPQPRQPREGDGEGGDEADKEADEEADAGGDAKGAGEGKMGAAYEEYIRAWTDVATELHLEFDPTPNVCGWLAELGAQVVSERSDWLPVRPWGGDAIQRRKGELVQEMLTTGLEHWSIMMFGKAGWAEADTRALLERVRCDVKNPGVRSYVKISYITAKKPLHDDDDDDDDGGGEAKAGCGKDE